MVLHWYTIKIDTHQTNTNYTNTGIPDNLQERTYKTSTIYPTKHLPTMKITLQKNTHEPQFTNKKATRVGGFGCEQIAIQVIT